MEYQIVKYKLRNGFEDISIIFSEKKYQLLSTFIGSDVSAFEEWTKEAFDKVLSGVSLHEEINGNICGAEIGPLTTKVYNLLIEDEEMCEVETEELRQIIEDWGKEKRRLRKI